MPMSFGGRAASSSACATRPRAEEIGSSVSVGHTRRSSPIGSYAMATAEHREPCDSRGSCTVLGAPGGEIPPGDSTRADETELRQSLTLCPQQRTVCCAAAKRRSVPQPDQSLRLGCDPAWHERDSVYCLCRLLSAVP